MHEIFGSRELTAGDKWQVLAKQAHTAMKKALSNLGEPVSILSYDDCFLCPVIIAVHLLES